MTTVHHDSERSLPDRDISRYLSAALKGLVELLSAWRVRRRARAELQGRSDFVPEDIRRTRTKIDPEWLRLEWF
jgi:hypothetical protein